jgi:hypothetical protein
MRLLLVDDAGHPTYQWQDPDPTEGLPFYVRATSTGQVALLFGAGADMAHNEVRLRMFGCISHPH